ncbi:hypothetical protein I6A84_21950 [Frankia sp. CNm7]|uniref:Uncharacterized protein n=1 Tax=Frankia nepalensis TaxID=1836974 RepID=A0A937RGY0_9ACTN|nr:hypothetical protein [Frankia nepalensis]MBL7502523.1 hypothetical protein [Frankia nepalensis]MBL7508892.1 hypothetical protein [Frankia nepalensis]MBL7520675.1 hypothetical protein [Frankia nepalensis]MBL7628669.1 hypothetical protein [Frankia nepalensis]
MSTMDLAAPQPRTRPAVGRPWRRAIGLLLAALTLVSGLVIAAADSADAAVVPNLGKKCVGVKVERCFWINFDTTERRVRAYATVRDTGEETNYDVAVRNIRVVTPSGNSYGLVADTDGWWNVTDEGHSNLVKCSDIGRSVYAVAEVSWRSGNGTETRTERSALATVC